MVSSRSITVFINGAERQQELITAMWRIGLSDALRDCIWIEYDKCHRLISILKFNVLEAISSDTITVIQRPVTECAIVLLSGDTAKAERLEYGLILELF